MASQKREVEFRIMGCWEAVGAGRERLFGGCAGNVAFGGKGAVRLGLLGDVPCPTWKLRGRVMTGVCG